MDAPQWTRDRTILDLVHESIYARDRDRKICFWNSSAEELYGWTSEEALGRHVVELLHCDYPASIDECERQLFETGQWQGAIERRTKAGSELLIEATWAVRRDASGKPVEIIETGRDITTKHAEDEARRLSEYRFRNLFDVMAVAFWEIDFNGVGALLIPLREAGITDLRTHLALNPELVRQALCLARVLDVNTKTLSLFGANSKEELVGKGVERFWPEESLPVFIESLVGAMERRSHYITEIKLLNLRGELIDVIFTVSWSPESRKQGIILLGVIDIGDRVDAERMLRQVQAEFAHAARVATLGELTASIAHEVNQPLAAITTNGEASLRWLARPEPNVEEVRTLAARMVADARRAAEVIARIRAMAAHQEPRHERLEINRIVDEAVQFLRRDLEENGVTIELALVEKLPAIQSDRTQLQQVIVNLVVNASQAMKGCSPHAKLIKIGTSTAGDMVRVEIQDRGPGIAEEHLPHLFDSFFTTKKGGLGIGLSLCRSIIEAHGGQIGATNLPTGALFHFELPSIA